jgi:hypothetical protein
VATVVVYKPGSVADHRQITKANWKAIDIDLPDISWTPDNDFTVDASEWPEEALEYVRKKDDTGLVVKEVADEKVPEQDSGAKTSKPSKAEAAKEAAVMTPGVNEPGTNDTDLAR